MLRKAVLIVNRAAGRVAMLRGQRTQVEALLGCCGFAVEWVETTFEAGSATGLARTAGSSASLVIACGGDGTVHEVAQGLAYTAAAMGVLPVGTANALARNLGLPMDPVSALRRLMTYAPRRIPLGEMTTERGTRYFVVMAGCGPDGALVHALSGEAQRRMKARFGRSAYYGHAARLFLTRSWPRFRVEYRMRAAGAWEQMEAVAVMAARVPDLGGLFSGLTAHAALTGGRLHVQVVRAPAQLSMPAWMLSTRLRLPNPWVKTVEIEELRCLPLRPGAVYAQADGELMGALPLTLRVVPEALWLMMPLEEDKRAVR